MNPESIREIQSNWEELAPHAEKMPVLFYQRLFEIAPDVKSLFAQSDMTHQGRQLVNAMDLLVQMLPDLAKTVPVLRALGHRHQSYGVVDRHYDDVGSALLWTLEKCLGPSWSSNAAAAWKELYGWVTTNMCHQLNERTS